MPHASVEFCAWIVLSHEYNSEAFTQSQYQGSCPLTLTPAAGKKQLCASRRWSAAETLNKPGVCSVH